MGNESYKKVWEAVKICEAHLMANFSVRFRLPKKAENPIKMGYDLDFDVSLLLEPDASIIHSDYC